MRPHLKPLTSLRFFAALAVFLFHWQALGVSTFNFGANGVSFFFVLSGFILTYVYPKVPPTWTFYRKRLARIWPIHIATFLVSALFLSHPAPGIAVPLNILLLHAWLPIGSVVYSFNAVSWSVSVEHFFYLCFPRIARAQRIAPYLLLTVLVAIILVVAANRYWFSPTNLPGFGWLHVILQHPFSRIIEFVVGMAVGRFFLNHLQQPPKIITKYPHLVEILAVAGLILGHIITTQLALAAAKHSDSWLLGQGLSTWLFQLGMLPAFAGCILVFAYARGFISRLLSIPFLVLLGEISYSTYMLHQLVLAFAVKYAAVTHLGLVLTLTIVTLITYLASYITWRLIEQPCRRLLSGST